MAAILHRPDARRPVPLTPGISDRLLAGGAALLLLAVVLAVARGHATWRLVPALVWFHLATIGVALAITPLMLLRPRGDRLHRRLGWTWAVAMEITALLSFGIRLSHPGRLSFIHLLSALVVVTVPAAVWASRSHKVAAHRARMRALVIGALLTAGFFTFPFNRLLGQWLFG